MNVKKRTLALILALIMLLSAASLAVSGDSKEITLEVDTEGYYLVNSYEELEEHVWANRNNVTKTLKYRLNGDVSSKGTSITVSGVNAVIDLNGYRLANVFSRRDSMISVENRAHLIIRDSSEEQTGRISFTSTYGSRDDLDDEDTGLVYMFWIFGEASLEIEGGTFYQNSRGAIIGANGGTVRIYDGTFEVYDEKAKGGCFIIDVHRTSADVPPAMIFIYDGTFRTMADTVWFDAFHFDDTYPLVAVLGGDFRTDSIVGFNYYRGEGDTFICGGLIPISSYEHPISNRKSYADGALTAEETIDGKKYVRASAPQWLVTDSLTAERRFEDAALRYVFSSYDKSSDYYAKYGDIISNYMRYPATAYIGERDLDPVELKVYGQRSGVKRMRLFSSSAIASTWADTTWNLVEAINSPEGDVTFTVQRPTKKQTRYYRLRVEYEDGTEWSDYIALDFAEVSPVMSGTAFPTQNAVRYGNTLFGGLMDLPTAIPVGSLRFEWFADGEKIGTERTVSLTDASWIGKELTVKVTSTVAVGSIVSAPVTIQKGVNNQIPRPATVRAEMSGNKLAKITAGDAIAAQEYLISQKKADALTAEDWGRAVRSSGASLDFTPGEIKSKFGIEPKNGDTLYVHTRLAETEGYLAGENVSSSSVYIGESVTLRSIVFPESANGTMYLSYHGYSEAYDIPYELVPVNANSGGDIRWRVTGPVTLEEPSGAERVDEAGKYITVVTNGLGTANITAYYTTNTENVYGRLQIVVYDPKNVGADLLKPCVPLPDVTIYAGDGYSAAIPEFILEPTEELSFKWYFTRGTMYGYERITETAFASIDPETGEIAASAPGRATVSLFADNTLVDSYELTVIEKPDGYVALEALYPEASSITLNVGEKKAIGVLKSPANASAELFKFSSSAPDVAPVDSDGTVYAHAKGSAVITVSAPAEGVSTTVKVTVNDPVPSTVPSGKLGDVNGDGKINSRDVIMIMKAVIVENSGSGEYPKGYIKEASDVYADGKLNSRDVIALMKAVISAVQES